LSNLLVGYEILICLPFRQVYSTKFFCIQTPPEVFPEKRSFVLFKVSKIPSKVFLDLWTKKYSFGLKQEVRDELTKKFTCYVIPCFLLESTLLISIFWVDLQFEDKNEICRLFPSTVDVLQFMF
jgi:hypothetical protein